jgi:hypothetical protein
MRVRAAWALTLPLLVVGELGGHWLAYRLADSDPHARAELLAQTGHGQRYLALLPPVVSVCLLLAALVFARSAVAGARPRRRLPAWVVVMAPAVGFVAQEFIERVAHTGRLDWTVALERAVVIGIALQIPCGVLCLWLVRALLRVADSVGSVLAGLGASRARRVVPTARWAALVLAVPAVAVAGNAAGRAPPLFG